MYSSIPSIHPHLFTKEFDEPERALAAGVIYQAVKDCCAPIQCGEGLVWRDTGLKCNQDANEARAFLSKPNPSLALWARVLGVEPSAIIDAYWSTLFVRSSKWRRDGRLYA